VLTSFHNLPNLISTDTHIDPYIRMRECDSNCTSQTNWFNFAGTNYSLSEPEPLNILESIEGLLNTEVDNLILPAYFWEQSNIPSPWNTCWTEVAAYGGGLELDDRLVGNCCTMYRGAHSRFTCRPEEPCECEGYGCSGTHSTEGHKPAAAATLQPAPVPLIVIEPLTLTPSEIDAYNWHG